MQPEIDRDASDQDDEPFVTFTEWAAEADEEAYADL
jgi:hypothetical protein